ncbi:bifunctional 5-dehydro-2-deoxygluconokinase/5-dehydro-2-deoxyphosphogluconate aldolase [Sphingobium sp.]|uniref:bifunctional 5-dehydro-2-deoxygluconokinase/5-dehydro-2- deoxyphosphogluconate aldolase n=1 Tax=Sphingobium sp. TaxID=1912891 RepID=UPI0028BD984E|nr:5-dehydro-2-deoxygluconokinase [Sphingobium sp.]
MDDRVDVLAIGRSSIDLYGDQCGGRLEDMASFSKYIGGSPTNSAIGCARLGLHAALLTRVGNDHFGRFIREELAREGVDVRGVVEDPERLTALAVLGIRDRENFPLLFYRENCADMAITLADLEAAWMSPRAVLINGTHLSAQNVREVSLRAAQRVREEGGRVVFDIDYRPVLWGLTGRDMGENRFVANAEVTARLQGLLPLCDLIVGTEEEIHILGGATDSREALRAIRQASDALIVMKRGPLGCVAFDGPIPENIDDGIQSSGFPVEVFNVLGAGDAFMAGFLRGWLRDEPVARCCELANACGALVVSRHGCAPAMPSWAELDYFLSLEHRPVRLGEDRKLAHIHWATTRPRNYDELAVLAIDHRVQLEDIAKQAGETDLKRIAAFKDIALRALDRVAANDPRFGILLDGRYGGDALARAADRTYWIGRPIELPKSRPLAFEGSPDVAVELAEWPTNHVVKCLVTYDADDPATLRDEQERQLAILFVACRKTRHELLLEIIAPDDSQLDSRTIARAIRRIYEIGIYPDWWKLEPSRDSAAWREIEAAIRENDPFCRGVVLLGLAAPIPELIEAFRAAAPVPIIRGFAVGRTIFQEAARGWLENFIDDETAEILMAERFATLVDAWRTARQGGEGA